VAYYFLCTLPEIREREMNNQGETQEIPCIYTLETGKHEWNCLTWLRQSNGEIWIPKCPSCGWIDEKRMMKDLKLLQRIRILFNIF
jgi:hypothetical protein